MKAKKTIQVSVLIFALVIAYDFWKPQPVHQIQKKKVSSIKLNKIASATPLKMSVDIAKISRANPKPMSAQPEAIPSYCAPELESLVTDGPLNYLETIKTDGHSCLRFLKEAKSIYESIKANCDFKNKTTYNDNLCSASLSIYRAILIDLNTLDDTDYAHMNLQVLLNKIISRITQGQDVLAASEKDLEKMALAARDIEPDNPSSYKTLAMMGLIFDNSKSVGKWAATGLELNPKDEELREIWLGDKAKNDPAVFTEYARNHPKDELVDYYKAYRYWKAGKTNEAIVLMENLGARSPGTTKYKNTLKNLKEGAAIPFSVEILIFNDNW